MKRDPFVKFLLLVIAVSLAAIALRPYAAPPSVKADVDNQSSLYFEPGTAMLRAPDGSKQVLGKVAIDLRNGRVWGFPTLQPDPYPISSTSSSAPPVSHPFLLGTFALNDVDK